MKHMHAFFLLTLIFHTTSALAASECRELRNAGDLFDSMKVVKVEASNAELLDFYTKTNKDMKDFAATTCDAGMDFMEIISESNRVCNTACVKHSKITKDNKKKFLKDCSSTCEGARASQNAYKTKLKEKAKNADVAAPTKESISNLKREAKELGLDLDGPTQPKAKKVHSK